VAGETRHFPRDRLAAHVDQILLFIVALKVIETSEAIDGIEEPIVNAQGAKLPVDVRSALLGVFQADYVDLHLTRDETQPNFLRSRRCLAAIGSRNLPLGINRAMAPLQNFRSQRTVPGLPATQIRRNIG